ncbi:lytic transglycosylase domain-containing protein [Roseomonas genomospecies 6]|uniref:Lytic transglycosylase domain-containing protein n=1 Tax=Roseomonas genomospecies 6 TaxID=214106 RepID=A0A9W7NI45_9PROT|nr:lytic transglycosylase domain-containing protein [Roseomonas genomospecies 6]KAA0679308.1 lytic transglycosylase domain-containing protein [Roseomonas genomospecies 6]
MAGVALALCAAPDPTGGYRPAQAGLVIHAPDGRPVVPPGFEHAEQSLLLATDADARTVQLTEEDARHYRRIFALQERGEWEGADWEMRLLRDRRLVGHVLRQRYLHPDRKASYDELASWLQRYGDLPGAERIHALAQRRAPAGQRALKPPRGGDGERLTGSLERLGGLRPDPLPETVSAEEQGDETTAESPEDKSRITVAPRSRTDNRSRADHASMARVTELLRAGKPGAALALLNQDEFGRNLDSVQYDRARARIAASLYYSGEVSQALSLASASAARSGPAVTEAHWIAGLAAWRLKQHDRAARHFTAMAEAGPQSPWLAAAADFWAARAHARKGRDEQARVHLTAAARYPHTFYGLLAHRKLGGSGDLNWRTPELTGRHLKALSALPGGTRAIALIQAGQHETAEMELRRIHPRGDALAEQALVALADRAGLPALALQVGNAVAGPDGAPYTAALYPVPHWKPRDGFAVDRALVFAVMRQESRFNPTLVSSAGATGLMQIMPATAQHVQERNRDIAEAEAAKSGLFDPSTNMELGQRYLAELLNSQDIGNNLFLLTAAYNAGPGTLARWRKELSDIDDPLLFIESLPYAETRNYVEKVVANFWIYRLRLGQETESLDAVAAGGWPVYMPVDVFPAAGPTQVAQHAETADAED